MKEYYTAQEFVDLARENHWQGFPVTKSGLMKFIKRENWQASPLAREREGKGGGLEYHYTLLTERLAVSVQAIAMRGIEVKNSQKRIVQDADDRKLLKTSDLTARQRAVMQARSAVLLVVEKIRIKDGVSRKKAIAQFLDNPLAEGCNEELLATANDKAAGKDKISERSVFRWFEYNKRGVVALAPNTAKKSGKIPSWFPVFLKYWSLPTKPTIADALRAYTRDLEPEQKPPSYDQCKRMIAKMGNVEKHKGREGALTLRARKVYKIRATDDMEPAIMYTADGKTFDAEIAHPNTGKPFRPEITTVIDVATRRVVGFSVGLAENSVGVVDALRHACENFGVPAVFYTDRGPGFKNKLLDDPAVGFCERFGVTKMHSLPYNSQARGIIERANGTIWNRFSKTFVSYIGKDMDKEAAHAVHKLTRKEIKQFGVSKTLPTWNEFLAGCNEAIEEYNAAPHSSLPKKMSPDAYWLDFIEKGFQPVTIPAEATQDIWRPYDVRKVQRGIINHNSNKYYSLELEEYNGEQVYVGYDVHDGTRLWIREIDKKANVHQMGRLICIAQFSGNKTRYLPHTMQKQAEETRQKRRLKLAMEKVTDIEQEFNPPTLIEAQVQPVMKLVEPMEPEIQAVAQPTNAPKKLKFSTDYDLAEWAIKNPEKLEAHHRSLLEQCLRRSSDRELLTLKGLDIERLENVLRQAA